jgi:hypothetical protein
MKLSRMRLGTLLAKTAVILGTSGAILGAGQAGPTRNSIRSFEPAAADGLLTCAKALTKKLVTGPPSLWRLLDRAGAPCPGTAAELKEIASKLDIVILDTSEAAYLAPVGDFKPSPVGRRFTWTALDSTVSLSSWEGIPDSIALDNREMIRIGDQARREMRPTPATPVPNSDPTNAVLRYRLRVNAQRLSKSEIVHVIVVAGADGEIARLGVAERRGATLAFLWDSPLFGNWLLQLGYSDLDGDGRKEIVLATATGMRGDTVMHAFTAEGR